MRDYSVGEAAGLLGVSADTVRRWIDTGALDATRTVKGRRRIEGAALARFRSWQQVSRFVTTSPES
jgi:excisionase family DNA binding protein